MDVTLFFKLASALLVEVTMRREVPSRSRSHIFLRISIIDPGHEEYSHEVNEFIHYIVCLTFYLTCT